MLTRAADHLDSDRYEQLVRFVFLLLDGSAADGSAPEDRLARAYRITGKAVRRRAKRSAATSAGADGPYHLARRRVLRHILRHEPEETGQVIRFLQPYIVALPHQALQDAAVSAMCQPVFGDLHVWNGDYNAAYGIDTSSLINEEVW
ncbi:hypothetical protein GCM10009676_13670 [Prauserella halophila]|uniref:Uncharacterized protein n=1 Tax=Prauserella halophila TaxID=185641 RepID=A0ABN1W633_9PSEU|nr:hypothetical protein [Prauserella halophila]MCP2236419.1 hypothetical protein [Prauserella halophila]